MKISSFIAAIALLAAVCNGADAPQSVEPQLAPNVADRWALTFPRDQDGFTIFPLGEGSRIVLVSSSDGSDFYDGMIQPVRTLKKALTLVRNGYPDRILFKRGDVFREAGLDVNIEKQGRSALEPFIIGAYGSTRLPRPISIPTSASAPRSSPDISSSKASTSSPTPAIPPSAPPSASKK